MKRMEGNRTQYSTMQIILLLAGLILLLLLAVLSIIEMPATPPPPPTITNTRRKLYHPLDSSSPSSSSSPLSSSSPPSPSSPLSPPPPPPDPLAYSPPLSSSSSSSPPPSSSTSTSTSPPPPPPSSSSSSSPSPPSLPSSSSTSASLSPPPPPPPSSPSSPPPAPPPPPSSTSSSPPPPSSPSSSSTSTSPSPPPPPPSSSSSPPPPPLSSYSSSLSPPSPPPLPLSSPPHPPPSPPPPLSSSYASPPPASPPPPLSSSSPCPPPPSSLSTSPSSPPSPPPPSSSSSSSPSPSSSPSSPFLSPSSSPIGSLENNTLSSSHNKYKKKKRKRRRSDGSPQPSKGNHKVGRRNGDGYKMPDSNNIFDVLSFGAKGDGITDDTQAFLATWEQACQVKSSIFEVPAYFVFVVGPIIFSGPCAYDIVFQIDGDITPVEDPQAWGGTNGSSLVYHWLEFAQVNRLLIQGDGIVDGSGDCWWSQPCKTKAADGHRISKACTSPTAIRIFGSYNVTVRDLIVRNSPQMHLKFDNCVDVHVDNVTISSPSNSPNTDGIHIQNTQIVDIRNSQIETGDDCISIQTGCSNIEIQNVVCTHGHGISIGGLGQQGTQACVSNISVHDVFIQDSQNGVRIKTWQGGSGSVKNVEFRNIEVRNISNPILIDQFYCDASSCTNQTSAVEVSQVSYNNIRGTYCQSQAVRLACSDTVACTDIVLSQVVLLPANGNFVDDPFCWNSYGSSQMPTIPPITCLQTGLPESSNQVLSNKDLC